MQYRTLGSTGISVSVIGVGTWQFGGEWGVSFSEGDVDGILGAALDEGINLIDTAECYGDHLAERLVGARLHREREKWIVATKFGHHFHGHMDRTRHWQPRDAREQLTASLAALRTDYVDLLQFHSPTDEEYFNEELWGELQRLREEGLVRSIGLSVSRNDNYSQVEAMPRAGCEALQIVYNRADRAPEEQILPFAGEHRIGVLARVPLASGFLTGKYDGTTRFPDNDWRGQISEEKRTAILDTVAEVQRSELPPDTSLAEWALVWPLRHGAVTAVIPGCKSVDQMRSNARAVRLL